MTFGHPKIGGSQAFSGLAFLFDAFQKLPIRSPGKSPKKQMRSRSRKAKESLSLPLVAPYSYGRLESKVINNRSRRYQGWGQLVQHDVEEESTYPQPPPAWRNMGNLWNSFNRISPCDFLKEWPKRRNSRVFPSIPNPYYDDYDHVYKSLRKP